MTKQQSISVKNVSLGYKKSGKKITILKNLDLEFFEGDFIGIVGLNGIGKSTLLKSLCGLLPVLSGNIFLNDRDIDDTPLTELAKKVSVVLTEKVGGFNLTAYDVVAAGQIPYTNSFHELKASNLRIIEAAIKACGIVEHQFKPVNELSDGLFQKTIIAKSLAQQTPFMLLDEPSAFLDYASKHDLFILLKKLVEEQQKCILVSSHDLDMLMKYCNKLVVISKDSVELIATTEAKQNKAFIQIGGGFI